MDKRRIFGENHPNAKLTDKTVRAIREEYAHGQMLRKELKRYTAKAIAKRYGVADTRVRAIISGEEWTHVE